MARKAHHGGRTSGPSQRQLKVGELIRHSLSQLLVRGDVHDEVLQMHTVTIPEVRCSPDLRNATVFVMPLGGRDTDAVLAALRRNSRYIRGTVAKAINLKYAPQLNFRVDETFDEAQRITEILHSPSVRRDLVGAADRAPVDDGEQDGEDQDG